MGAWNSKALKENVTLVVNVALVLGFVAGTALLANRWRLEGNTYKVTRKADGEIEKNRRIAEAERDAGIIKTRLVAEGEKERAVKLAEGAAKAKYIEAEAETTRTLLKNESIAAQAEAIRALGKQ